MKKYTRPPLPFIGAKRNCIKEIAEIIERFKAKNSDYEDYIFVDLFGGSGFLSHTIKYLLPKNRVVWNDYENYSERLHNRDQTEEIRKEIHEVVKEKQVKYAIIAEEEEIKKILEKYENYDEKTLCSWLNFAGQNTGINWWKLYHKIPKNPVQCVKGYLEGVESVQMDYAELFEKFQSEEKVFFLFDPPYLNTKNDKYKMDMQWWLADYLDIAEKVFEIEKYMFFTSEKSSMLEFLDYLQKFFGHKNFEKMSYNDGSFWFKEFVIFEV